MPIRVLPILLVAALVAQARAGEAIPLRLAATGHQQATVSSPASGLWELRTTGLDPYVVSEPAIAPFDLAATPILAFDFICAGGLDSLEVFAGPAWSAQRRIDHGPLPPREGWSPCSIDLRGEAAVLGSRPTAWRLDLGSRPDRVLQIRNLRLRAPDAAELAAAASAGRRRAEDPAHDRALREYLAQPHPGSIVRIVADQQALTVSGQAPAAADDLHLAEWPIWQPLATGMRFASTWPVRAGAFALGVPRFAPDGSDRLLSRFVLVQRRADGDRLLSHGRWCDVIPSATALPAAIQRSRKGLGGFTTGGGPVSDLDELGIGSITVNVPLSDLFQAGPGDGAEAVAAGGRTWWLRRHAFDALDASMLAAAERRIVVLGIILVPPARAWAAQELGALLQHPDYHPAGVFTMPNLTTAESAAAYAMALDLLARRYSRADGKYGRMHHWIMHNEVDMGWVWTNCGARPERVFFDQYYRSMRLAHLILRRQDAHAKVFISLTHHWARTAEPATCFPSLNLLGHLLALGRAEGDFEWGLAHHPYPSSLLEPKSWLDRDAEFRLDTPKITFRNLEVLDAWVRRPEARFAGRVRSVHLSEQGPNSRDYGEQALREQAAALAYVWKKLAALDSIEGFEYHNWIDNRHEGGLRIGLRRFPDDDQQPLGPKPIWHLYRALGTADEDRACAFAMPVIGIADWIEVRHRGAIPAIAGPAVDTRR